MIDSSFITERHKLMINNMTESIVDTYPPSMVDEVAYYITDILLKKLDKKVNAPISAICSAEIKKKFNDESNRYSVIINEEY